MALTSYVLLGECDEDSWYVDNGATSHITNQGDVFETFEYFKDPHVITTANGDNVKAVGKGVILVQSEVQGYKDVLRLSDVWYVPQIKKNLFSVLHAQDKHPASQFISSTNNCSLTVDKKIVLLGKRSRYGGLYKLALHTIKAEKTEQINSVSHDNLLQLYHERFGHQNKKHIRNILASELNLKVNLDSEICEGCVYGKMHRKPFGTRERAKMPGELLHSDVCGPFEKSQSDYRYFVLFKDDFSRFRFVYFMKEKSEVAEKLKIMLNELRTTEHYVKVLLSDNGGEFDNSSVRKILQENGIQQRLIMPYTPEQNGCAERDNRTIVETARSIIHAHEVLPQYLWAEMINTAVYIINRTGVSSVKEKSPFELWFNKKASLKHMRIIGSSCYVHVPKQMRRKMDKKVVKGILMGYDNDDGYHIWCRETKKLIRSRDVIFDEKLLLCKSKFVPTVSKGITEERKTFENEEDIIEYQNHSYPDVLEEGATFKNDEEDTEYQDHNLLDSLEETPLPEEPSTSRQLRDRNQIKKPSKFEDFIMMVAADIMNIQEPKTYGEAMNDSRSQDWKMAMDKEMQSLKSHGV